MGSMTVDDCVFTRLNADMQRFRAIEREMTRFQLGPRVVQLERGERIHPVKRATTGKCPGCGSHETRPHKGGLFCSYCSVER